MTSCCSPCASRSDDAITAIVRVCGPLAYGGRTEIVAPHADSLGDPAALRGLRVELGHGGEVVGRILSAKRVGHALIATIEVTDPRHRADLMASEYSLEYDVARLDPDGTQRGVTFRALASVPRGRCDLGSGVCRTLSRPSHKDSHMLRRDVDARTGPVEPTADDPAPAPAHREGEAPSAQRMRATVSKVEGPRVTLVLAEGATLAPGDVVSIEVTPDPARADASRDSLARDAMISRMRRPQPVPQPPVRATRSQARAYR